MARDSSAPSPRSDLSSNTLSMKFMQKSKERVERKMEEEKLARGGELHETKSDERVYMLEPSLAACEGWKYTRMSFNGKNKNIELLMQKLKSEREQLESEEREKVLFVDDEEMANRYNSLVGTIAKKFGAKKHKLNAGSSKRQGESSDDGVVASYSGKPDGGWWAKKRKQNGTENAKSNRPRFLKPSD